MSDQQSPDDPPRQPPYDPSGRPFGGPPSGPPSAGQPRPWEQGGAWQNQPDPAPHYPRQNLLPQEIKAGRNRKPAFIAVGAVLALLIAGGIGYLVFRDDGEDTRQAYCAALRDVTNNGDLVGAVNSADPTLLEDLKTLMNLAPNAVADDWKKVDQVVSDAQSGSPDLQQALTAYSALKSIATDAKNNCGLDLNIPML